MNAAMITGNNPTSWPVLTQSSLGAPTDGFTLTMETQRPGNSGTFTQAWWIEPIGSPSMCIGLNAPADHSRAGLSNRTNRGQSLRAQAEVRGTKSQRHPRFTTNA